jgi:hypothetical protein
VAIKNIVLVHGNFVDGSGWLLLLDQDKFAASIAADVPGNGAVTETPGSHPVYVSRPAVVAAVISQAAQGLNDQP